MIRNEDTLGLENPFGVLSSAEQAFLEEAELIAQEVAAMTDEEVADYIIDNDLQDLITPERIDAILQDALDMADTPRAPILTAANDPGVRRRR
jgi:hypothetical protein